MRKREQREGQRQGREGGGQEGRGERRRGMDAAVTPGGIDMSLGLKCPEPATLLQSSGAAQPASLMTLSLSSQPSLYPLSVTWAFAKPQAHLRLPLL